MVPVIFDGTFVCFDMRQAVISPIEKISVWSTLLVERLPKNYEEFASDEVLRFRIYRLMMLLGLEAEELKNNDQLANGSVNINDALESLAKLSKVNYLENDKRSLYDLWGWINKTIPEVTYQAGDLLHSIENSRLR